MQNLRLLLLPFSFIYGLVVAVRNFLFDKGILKSTSFRIPIISVGNLSTGGTGKTPHVEYLIRLLRSDYRIATLSRGYGRKTSGFMLVSTPASTSIIGDEPMQYHTKYKDILVSVGEDRVEAIENLLGIPTPPEIILMDDAFQHRKLKPGKSILLIEYESIFKQDFLLPAGNLREWVSGMKRADIIIISKSPSILVPIERKRVIEEIKPLAHQEVFFSYYRYGDFLKVNGDDNAMLMSAKYYLEKRFTILMVTGIANPSGIMEYLRRHTDKLETLIFPDHHEFSVRDIRKIQETFDNIANASKIIVTTEKDAMRLRNPEIARMIEHLPIFYIPIEVVIHQEEEKFNTLITDYVRQN
ncbi:MAG TPA: tetraacyldisaccharide 4'-kinase [Bacteroidia bacterium]|nr:tetraacyldisaccharide 4'-kinase [Bacteroidia bacterium]HNS11606.1 tetraacyldisaccharide 4'-kinase [Bacteroidia bacterium]